LLLGRAAPEVCSNRVVGGFLPRKTKILAMEKEPANNHEISLIL